jgi:hypothetical protein
MVPMSIFGDPFFSSDYERVGRWVHHWNHAVWKKNPRCTFLVDEDERELALQLGWLVRDRIGLRYTGPAKDKRWLLSKRRTWQTYFVEAVGQGLVKIGKSTDVEKRIDGLQVASAFELRVLAVIDGDHERAWHRRFHVCRTGGEWFHLTDELRAAIAEMEG